MLFGYFKKNAEKKRQQEMAIRERSDKLRRISEEIRINEVEWIEQEAEQKKVAELKCEAEITKQNEIAELKIKEETAEQKRESELRRQREIEYDEMSKRIQRMYKNETPGFQDFLKERQQNLSLIAELMHKNSDLFIPISELEGENKEIWDLIVKAKTGFDKSDYYYVNDLLVDSISQRCREYGKYLKAFYESIFVEDFDEVKCLILASDAVCHDNKILAYCYLNLCNRIIVNKDQAN